MPKVTRKSLYVRFCIIDSGIYKFFNESEMMFDRIEKEGFRYLEISFHIFVCKDTAIVRKKGRMI